MDGQRSKRKKRRCYEQEDDEQEAHEGHPQPQSAEHPPRQKPVVGHGEQQTDKAFVQFKARKYGYRAAFKLLRTYIEKRGANTIGKIIARWAPSADGNNTQAYIDYVSRTAGIPADEPLRFQDQQAMVDVVRSMAQMESGLIEQEATLNEAYLLSV